MNLRWTLALAAALTAILFALVDFAPDTSLFGRILMGLFAWAFLAFGIWSIQDGISALIGLAQRTKEIPKATAQAKGAHAAAWSPNAQTVGKPAAPHSILSPEDEVQLAGWIEAFVKAGIIDAALFDQSARNAVRESVSGWGEATPYAILMGIEEIGGGQMHAGGMLPAVAFLDSKGEQLREGFLAEVADLERVTGGALALGIDRLNVPDFDAMATHDVELHLRIQGQVEQLRWRSAVKYSSTVLLCHVARAYHALGRGDALATLWSDQGSFILRLTPAQYRNFNARMTRQECEDERFSWAHRQAPFASGDATPG